MIESGIQEPPLTILANADMCQSGKVSYAGLMYVFPYMFHGLSRLTIMCVCMNQYPWPTVKLGGIQVIKIAKSFIKTRQYRLRHLRHAK